ncbi:hypothetical protein PAPYR_1695 [Paratrimastix pyriformis]|uniref:Uncharacterized protein n=1 Tax=Paratrimastix pyriformis TaxID=342808 RepID=A0ABQ8UX95_9EUKA|nr:hypothetical protein PAPYR_1695 [Paratrimastix pyriformis]
MLQVCHTKRHNPDQLPWAPASNPASAAVESSSPRFSPFPPSSPSPAPVSPLNTITKRVRTEAIGMSPPTGQGVNSFALAMARYHQNFESPFPVPPPDDDVTRYLPRHVRARHQTRQLNPDEPVLSLNDVREMMKKLIADRDQRVRGEYDHILEEKLLDQYNSFASYSQTYLSQKMRERTEERDGEPSMSYYS